MEKSKDDKSTYVLAEFNALRDEINNLNNLVSSILQISMVASLGLLSYIIQLEKSEISLLWFPAPFLIIIPSLFIILSRFQSIMRVSGYIRAFLEKSDGLSYENRYIKWLKFVSKSGNKLGFSYRETIFYLYISIGLLSIGTFYFKGFRGWNMLLYLLPIPFYYYAHLLIKRDWREIYDKYWREVKKTEEQQPNINVGQ